jgi:hypothetical protein
LAWTQATRDSIGPQPKQGDSHCCHDHAIVALITLGVNHNASVEVQRDVQFYEALKRLGDPSPAIRISAAGLLTQIGQVNSMGIPGLPKRYPYLRTALDQLVSSAVVEGYPTVLSAISTSAIELTRLDPGFALERTYAANLEVQRRLAAALGDFAASSENARTRKNHWWRAARLTEYDASVLQFAAEHNTESRSAFSAGYVQSRMAVPHASDSARALVGVAHSLRTNVSILAHILTTYDCHGVKLREVFLSDVDLQRASLGEADMFRSELSYSDLRNADLRYTDLRSSHLKFSTLLQADLRHASLQEAQMNEAYLGETRLEDVNLFFTNL